MYDRLAGKTMMRFAAHAFTILDLFVEIQSSADGKCLPIRERLFTKSSRVYCANLEIIWMICHPCSSIWRACWALAFAIDCSRFNKPTLIPSLPLHLLSPSPDFAAIHSHMRILKIRPRLSSRTRHDRIPADAE